jgi:ubiquinone/menaquinone biosynthesis C-methylase UbiE
MIAASTSRPTTPYLQLHSQLPLPLQQGESCLGDADAFLARFHDRNFGATSAVFPFFRTADGSTSYDLVMRAVPRQHSAFHLLDIGCGDGYLLEQVNHSIPRSFLYGIDSSRGELVAAHRRLRHVPAALYLGRAETLKPFADASMDAAISHMVLMLVPDARECFRAIRRVVRPGGTFSAIIGRRSDEDGDALQLFSASLRKVIRGRALGLLSFGDTRLRSIDGLYKILSDELGPRSIKVTDLAVAAEAPSRQIWNYLAPTYDIAQLTRAEQRAVKRDFLTRCSERWGSSSAVRCTIALRHVICGL